MTHTMYKTAAVASAAALALAAFGAWTSLAFADGGTTVHVDNSNNASVINTLTVGANTGGNMSLGGNGEDGGNGGNTSGMGTLRGGAGGAGGAGATGGHITTGAANAIGQIETDANSNLTNLQLSGGSSFHHDSSNHTSVTSSNWASVINTLQVNAATGNNNVSGGNGDSGGNGGSATAAAWHHWYEWWEQNQGSGTGGNGGAGGAGGAGGTIVTGAATSGGTVLNVLNTNVTRIHSTSSSASSFPFPS